MKRHALILWVLGPLLLLLSGTRPFVESAGRVDRLPEQVGDFRLAEEYELTDRVKAMLGTDDARQVRFDSPTLGSVFVVAVLHRENWKSVHPPHTCLRGSNMQMLDDGRVSVEVAGLGEARDIGRLLLSDVRSGRRYLSYYAYVAPDELVTGSYWDFLWHHAPLALVRQGVGGCLLRVETWVDPVSAAERRPDDLDVAEMRCRAFVETMMPPLREIFR